MLSKTEYSRVIKVGDKLKSWWWYKQKAEKEIYIKLNVLNNEESSEREC